MTDIVFRVPKTVIITIGYIIFRLFISHFREVSDFSNMDLLVHDKRILELLSLKYRQLAAAEKEAHLRHLEWQRDNQDMEQKRANKDIQWQNLVLAKRKQEYEINSKKMLEAKNEFIRSQTNLRNLIIKKEQRREKLYDNAVMQKRFSLARWKFGEEARRSVVEEALEQLLARDAQYRKELKSHIQTRLEAAKERKRYHRQQYIQVFC